jgi:hypothetical protein
MGEDQAAEATQRLAELVSHISVWGGYFGGMAACFSIVAAKWCFRRACSEFAKLRQRRKSK